MLCDNCHERDAVVHLTQIENNSVTQIHLCEQCAAERGVETTDREPKHPLGRIPARRAGADGGARTTRREQCAFCGVTMADFRATGRLGCARCYATFESSMRELLRRLHGSSQHVGEALQVPRSESVERAARAGRAAGAAAARDRRGAVRAGGRPAGPDPGAGMIDLTLLPDGGRRLARCLGPVMPTSCSPRGCGWRATSRGSRSRRGHGTASGCACCSQVNAAAARDRCAGWAA